MDATIFDIILSFILTLYADPSLARNIVEKVIIFFHCFLKNIFMKHVEDVILHIIHDSESKDEEISRIKATFKQYSDAFNPYLKEEDRFNQLNLKHRYRDPYPFQIPSKWSVIVNDEDELIFIQESLQSVKIPLDYSLKLFLEKPGMFNNILSYINQLSKEKIVISNIVQGLWWKSLEQSSDITLPLYLFCDDITTGNALGSHSNAAKFTAIYASIACLPPKIASRLDSIIFSRVIRTDDKKRMSKKDIFKDIIEELKFLQESNSCGYSKRHYQS